MPFLNYFLESEWSEPTDEEIITLFDDRATIRGINSKNRQLSLYVSSKNYHLLLHAAELFGFGDIIRPNKNGKSWAFTIRGNDAVPYAIECLEGVMKNTYKLEKWKEVINANN